MSNHHPHDTKNKERIIVVICTFEDGTAKIPLWIVGKYLNPRCFKNVNRDKFFDDTNSFCTVASIIVVICTNGDGTKKIPLLIVGKYLNPRCFNNVNRDNLGCQYKENKKSWMTQILFVQWLQAFDLRMENRKVLLLLDNCTAHVPLAELPNHIQLRNIIVHYLPPNLTSKLQPFDAGIICNFKAYYGRRFNCMLLERLESNAPDPEKIDILEVIRVAVAAWTFDVKSKTNVNCFLHCKNYSAIQGETEGDVVDGGVMRELKQQIHRLHYRKLMDVIHLLNHPAGKEVCYTPTKEDTINHVTRQNNDDMAEIDDDDGDSHEVPKVFMSKAVEVLKLVGAFWLQQDGDHNNFLRTIQKMNDDIENLKYGGLVQTNILKLFS